jgi:ATP-binding cassette, subfamily B (MDR/TAP), member 1
MSSGLTRRPLSTPVEAMPRVYTRQVLLYQLLEVAAAAGAGIARPLMTVIFGNLVNKFNQSAAVGDLQSAIYGQVLYLVYLFIGQWVLICAYGVLLSIAAMQFSVALRNAYLRTAICRRPGDAIESNAATDLSSSMSSIEDALAEKLEITVQAISTVCHHSSLPLHGAGI